MPQLSNTGIKEGRRKVFLGGAGISVDPPSSCPSAKLIIEEVLKQVAPDSKTCSDLLDHTNPGRSDAYNAGDYIRFELLLDVIQSNSDPELDIVGVVGISGEPNSVHHYLAQQAIAGEVVMTTNFDDLIERAILMQGGAPFTVCEPEDFQKWMRSSGGSLVPVFKLHGSLVQHTGDHGHRESIHTVQATLSAVTAGASELILPEPKFSFLEDVTHNATLIICGYSGSDDFDIVPTLASIDCEACIWIEHDEYCSKPIDKTDWLREQIKTGASAMTPAKENLFRNLLKPSTEFQYVAAQTRRDISSFASGGSNSQPLLPQDSKPLRNSGEDCDLGKQKDAWATDFIESWSAEHVQKMSDKFAIAAELFFRLSRISKAGEMFSKAVQTESDIAKRTKYNLGLSNSLAHEGKYSEANEILDELLPQVLKGGNAKNIARALHQKGFCVYYLGDLEEANEWYKRCIDHCENHDELDIRSPHAASIHDRALIQEDRGNYSKATSLLKQSIEVASHGVPIRQVSFSYHHIGNVSLNQAKFEEARAAFESAMEIALLRGDPIQECNSEHGLGLIDFMAGNLLMAVKRFRKGVRIRNRTGRTKQIGASWQHIGAIFLECARYESALYCFSKAEEGHHAVDSKPNRNMLSEVFSYLTELRLRCGAPEEALKLSRRSVKIAEREGLPEYILRSNNAFNVASAVVSNDKIEVQPLHRAKELGLYLLLLEQVVLCTRFPTRLPEDDETRSMLLWAKEIYSDIGNAHRRDLLESAMM